MRARRATSVLSTVLVTFLVICAACSNTRDEQDASPAGERQADRTPSDPQSGNDSLLTGSVPPALPSVAIDPASSVIVGHVTGESVRAYAAPQESAAVVAELSNPTPVGGPLVFQAVQRELPPGDWIEVYLPVRPNGTTGWVALADLKLSANPYRIEIDRAGHQLTVFRGDAEWLTTAVAIGTGDTPTPVGRFYIIELLRPPTPTGIYGSFAFGLSGFSETLTSFAGGEGVIGIHGTNDPTSIGSDVSHGCVRVPNEVIEAMAGVLPLGTPVEIV